ncbi:hypothetical protein HOD83_02585 [Candidatus Woesearchaeota archaeon]|nr:hypothetical protein [Candidatus Woesearchaeota archaeon]MBT4114310.1 hypothetical protein [Candidatus Woesearchaeota archaeon]MBT4248454.1 hypothetical protein [Candidatus Woesearchaeota archaeon]
MAIGKKGYAYFIELALAIIIIFIILSGYLESEQTVFSYKQNQDLKESGWYVLKNLDYHGKLNTSNFTEINTYIDASLDDSTEYDLELYNDTGCFPVAAGTVSSTSYAECSSINATTQNNVVSVFYTTIDNNESVSSVRLYLWRRI